MGPTGPMRTTQRRAQHDPVSSVTRFVTILTGSWTQSSYPQLAIAPAVGQRQFGTLGAMYRGVPDVAELQAGVVSAAQLQEAGFTRNGLSSRVRTGRWQRLHRGVYATFSGEPGREATLWAAILACGPGAMLSYQTGAEVAGLTDKRGWLVHVTVPGDRRVAPIRRLVIHYSARASQALHPARIPPQTRIEETILDLAGTATKLDDACGWVTAGIGRRLTNEARLRRAMAQRGKMRWRPELAELLSPAVQGVHSPLEWRHLRDVERPHGLPAGTRQALARTSDHNAYRDQLYEAYGIALELDGRVAHPGDRRWDDIRRDNAAAANRIITLRYGWTDVAIRPCEVAAEIAQVLMSRGFTGARPCSPRCPVGAVVARLQPPA